MSVFDTDWLSIAKKHPEFYGWLLQYQIDPSKEEEYDFSPFNFNTNEDDDSKQVELPAVATTGADMKDDASEDETESVVSNAPQGLTLLQKLQKQAKQQLNKPSAASFFKKQHKQIFGKSLPTSTQPPPAPPNVNPFDNPGVDASETNPPDNPDGVNPFANPTTTNDITFGAPPNPATIANPATITEASVADAVANATDDDTDDDDTDDVKADNGAVIPTLPPPPNDNKTKKVPKKDDDFEIQDDDVVQGLDAPQQALWNEYTSKISVPADDEVFFATADDILTRIAEVMDKVDKLPDTPERKNLLKMMQNDGDAISERLMEIGKRYLEPSMDAMGELEFDPKSKDINELKRAAAEIDKIQAMFNEGLEKVSKSKVFEDEVDDMKIFGVAIKQMSDELQQQMKDIGAMQNFAGAIASAVPDLPGLKKAPNALLAGIKKGKKLKKTNTEVKAGPVGKVLPKKPPGPPPAPPDAVKKTGLHDAMHNPMNKKTITAALKKDIKKATLLEDIDTMLPGVHLKKTGKKSNDGGGGMFDNPIMDKFSAVMQGTGAPLVKDKGALKHKINPGDSAQDKLLKDKLNLIHAANHGDSDSDDSGWDSSNSAFH